MKVKEHIPIIVLGLILVSCGIFFLVQQRFNIQGKLSFEYEKFYKSDFNGTITFLDGSSGRFYFKINNSNKKYFVTPYSINSDQPSFYQVTDIGDKLIKIAYSDTLVIVSKGNNYRFTFKDYSY